MKIVIDRKWKKDTYTIGKCYVDGVEFSETMEDRDRGLDDSMSLSEIQSKKVYGETAIPKGTYVLKLSYSPKFAKRIWGKRYGGKVPEIQGVKGFSGIRIHPLNFASDSLGCIGLGRNLHKGVILESTKYYYRMMDQYIVPASKTGETIWITIK